MFFGPSQITVLSAQSSFLCKHPGLVYGLAAFYGFSFAFQPAFYLLLPLGLLTLACALDRSPYARRARRLLILGAVLAALLYAYAQLSYQFPDPGTRYGEGEFHVSRVVDRQRHGVKRQVWYGVLRSFRVDGVELGRHLPVSVSFPKGSQGPDAGKDYLLHGRLRALGNGRFSINLSSSKSLQPIEGTWSTAAWRYRLKRRLTDYIQSHVPSRDSAAFLTGLLTGEFDHKILRFELAQLGIQHVMAISGFHFAIIATFLHALLRCWLPYRYLSLCLALCLSTYYLFIGSGPSIQRAWVSSLIFLGTYACERTARSPNVLGLAMLAVLLSDPLLVLHRGFHYSFLATAAILVIFPPLERVIGAQPLFRMVEMPRWDQHTYLFLSAFRKAFALTLAVHLPMLLLIMCQGQSFPIWALVANLIFPFLVSGVLLLLLVIMLLAPIWGSLAQLLLSCLDFFVGQVLHWIFHSPLCLRWVLPAVDLSPYVAALVTALFFLAAVFFQQRRESEGDLHRDFLFV